MTTRGTQLTRLLYYTILITIGIVGVGAVVALVALGTAVAAPDSWPAGTTMRINGGVASASGSMEDRAVICLLMIGVLALAAGVLLPLLGLVRSAMHGTPFVDRNVTRLRGIAIVFALVAVSRVVVPLVVPSASLGGWLAGPAIDIGPILMALVILVLAEVFQEGVCLREDVEGTV